MLLTAILASYAATAVLSRHCEGLLFKPYDGLRNRASSPESSAEANATQRLSQTKNFYRAEYRFENFNGDALHVSYQAPRRAYEVYCADFWYSLQDLNAIATHQDERAVDAYLSSRGFKRLNKNTIEADVPGMVKRSSGPLKSLSSAFDHIAVEKNYDSESLIGSVTAMVQTALHFRIPPLVEDGRRTGGILPPVMSLMRGWGNCNTKTGLLASILANWPNMRMIGITPPGHYLMGVLRIPTRGDAFVEYQGLQYVLIEPAGPAWLPPGTVGEDTWPELKAAEGFRVEPFFDES